jgi:hypothetical protein
LYNIIIITIFLGGVILGAYGSPDTGNLYNEEKPLKIKKHKGRIQTNLIFLIPVIIFNISFVLTLGIKFDNILTALMFDSIVFSAVSAISLVHNLVKKNKVKDDIIFLLSSIVAFFVFSITLGSKLNS